MAHKACLASHSISCCFAAVVLCSLVSQGHGRLLVEQRLPDILLGLSHVSGDADGIGTEVEATSATAPYSTALSPFQWVKEQLHLFAAMEQDVMQRLEGGMFVDETVSHEALLRNVGCARMRAALLNRVAEQGANLVFGLSNVEHLIDDDEENSGVQVLHGTERADTTAAGAVSGNKDGGASDGKVRILQDETFHHLYYEDYDEEDEEDEDAEVEDMWSEGNSGDDEESYEFYDTQSYDYAYAPYDAASDETTRAVEDADALGQKQLDSAQRSQAETMLSLMQTAHFDLESRILERDEEAERLASGDDDAEGTLEAGMQHRIASRGAASYFNALASASSSTSDAVATAKAVVLNPESAYKYEMLDRADQLAWTNAPEDDNLYGYEYLYDDYYQTMTLADILLSRLDTQPDGDDWADYLEQMYEYFAFYTEEDGSRNEVDNKFDREYGTSAVEDTPGALAALTDIAELVLWAHMGSFVLEVRPALTITRISSEGLMLDAESVFIISSQPDASYSSDPNGGAMVYGLGPEPVPEAWFFSGGVMEDVRPPVEIVNDVSWRLVFSDGSINWELVTVVILAAGTLAMLVGCLVSWLSLRRSMACASRGWVYVPPLRAAKRCGKGVLYGDSSDSGAFDAALVLRPDDVKGAVCWGSTSSITTVEDASLYVAHKVENESIAKALYK